MRPINTIVKLFNSPHRRRTHLWLPLFMGLAGGFILALSLVVMEKLSHLIWEQQYQQNPVFIFGVFLLGGLLIGWLQQRLQQLRNREHPAMDSDPRQLWLLILIGILAVGLGASVGPEAAIMAAGAQLALVIRKHLPVSQREAGYIERLGQTATLGEYYYAPVPGATQTGLVAAQADEVEVHGFAQVLTLACVILGFYFSLRGLNPEGSLHRIRLVPSVLSLDLWAPVAAALVAGGFTLLFVRLGQGLMQSSHQVLKSPLYRGILSGVLMGLVFAVHPFLRGTGYYELEFLQTHEVGVLALLLIALLKLAMTLLSVTGGWLGGTIFPLFFVGAALGSAVVQLIPGNTDAAMLAAMTTAIHISLRKPLLLILLMVLLVERRTCRYRPCWPGLGSACCWSAC
ncbi:MAG: chloride channel protein [Thiothrix sp.]|nr:chloride channel protein [Thiothrix sp.]HPQ96090.1 chloride channel protein [Thiolinea sp.]